MAAGIGAQAVNGPNGSVRQQVAIVTGDTPSTNFPPSSRGIYVGVSGDVNWLAVDDILPVVWKNVPVGIMPVCAIRVYATGTGASSMVALY